MSAVAQPMDRPLCAGEWVEVRSHREILATLDAAGCLEALPFMPEMLRHCGRKYRVYKRAHKTCDFVNNTGCRSLPNAVHLEGLRCDGSAHGGCQAECLIFWKEAWLKRCAPPATADTHAPGVTPDDAETQRKVWANTQAAPLPSSPGEPVYVCQATRLPEFTAELSPWNLRQYVEDYRSGNEPSLWRMLPSALYRAYNNVMDLGIGLGPAMRWLYDAFQRARGGRPYPGKNGRVPAGEKTPDRPLNLQPGDWVRVRSHEEILATLDGNLKNRGMAFSPEMVLYCGGTYRVHSRVNQIVCERTGRMLKMKSSCIVLADVICRARYNKAMLFCPRATLSYWREIWLERVEPPAGAASAPASSACAT